MKLLSREIKLQLACFGWFLVVVAVLRFAGGESFHSMVPYLT